MIAVFKPVNNTLGFDIREIYIKNNSLYFDRFLKVNDYQGEISKLPVFKPRVTYSNDSDFLNQFEGLFFIDNEEDEEYEEMIDNVSDNELVWI